MRKHTREIVFEGINNRIKEVLNALGYTEIEYLNDFCKENDFELIVKTQSYKTHEETCEIGWNDNETSENISDILLYFYYCNVTNDAYLMYDIYITNGIEKVFVETLDIKDYTSLVIVDGHGIETDTYSSEFVNAIVEKVNESLNNNNLQSTAIYESIFKTQEDTDDDEKYNTNYNYLIDRIVKSVRKYMLKDTNQHFDVNVSTHYTSCYFFYEVPNITDYYTDDICDVLDYKDR